MCVLVGAVAVCVLVGTLVVFVQASPWLKKRLVVFKAQYFSLFVPRLRQGAHDGKIAINDKSSKNIPIKNSKPLAEQVKYFLNIIMTLQN